tara:strand:+ start:3887 stop:4567 length:681 start_codon:yes stop_codon:yes gene_type:complete
MKLAIIPARGGSKRIPKKNIKSFFGKPILYYPLRTACESDLFDRVVVSSDDNEILDIASNFSENISCYKRPANLADDFTSTLPVIKDYILSQNDEIRDVCCIYPCTPFLTKQVLIDFYEEYKKDRGYFYFPVIKSQSIFRALEFKNRDQLSPVFFENQDKRTQDIEETFFDAGQFYFGSKENWLSDDVNIHSSARAKVVDKLTAIDIDEMDDWNFAEYLYEKKYLQ